MDTHRSRVLRHVLERAGRHDQALAQVLQVRLEMQHLGLMASAEAGRTDLTPEELLSYLSVMGVSGEQLREICYAQSEKAGNTEELVLKKALPSIEAHILQAYERVGKVMGTSVPEQTVRDLVTTAETMQKQLSQTRQKQREIATLGVSLLRAGIKACSGLESQRTLQSDSQDPASVLRIRTDVLKLHRQCLTQSLVRDLYSPQALEALKVIRRELEQRLEEVKDRLAIEKDRLDRFSSNPKLRQVCEDYQRVQLEIQHKRNDLEKLAGA